MKLVILILGLVSFQVMVECVTLFSPTRLRRETIESNDVKQKLESKDIKDEERAKLVEVDGDPVSKEPKSEVDSQVKSLKEFFSSLPSKDQQEGEGEDRPVEDEECTSKDMVYPSGWKCRCMGMGEDGKPMYACVPFYYVYFATCSDAKKEINDPQDKPQESPEPQPSPNAQPPQHPHPPQHQQQPFHPPPPRQMSPYEQRQPQTNYPLQQPAGQYAPHAQSNKHPAKR